MLTGLFQEAQQNRHSIAGAITMASSSSRPISYSSNTPDNCLGFHTRARAALLVCGRIKQRLYYRVGCIYIIYIYVQPENYGPWTGEAYVEYASWMATDEPLNKLRCLAGLQGTGGKFIE